MSDLINITQGDAILVVDLQNDFVSGSLAVKGAAGIIPYINAYTRLFRARQRPEFWSKCWHPKDHCSFKEQGGPWPPHGIQNTWGAAPPAEAILSGNIRWIAKGLDSWREEYSAFDHPGFHKLLRLFGIRRLFVGGLTTEYCVKAVVLAGLKLGYEVIVLNDAIASVNFMHGVDARCEMGGHTPPARFALGSNFAGFDLAATPSVDEDPNKGSTGAVYG